MIANVSEASLLDALEGVAYLADLDGMIRALRSVNWMTTAREAGTADRLAVNDVIGRNLYDIIQGNEVRQWYRNMTARLVGGGERQISFTYRCDQPDMQREMRMCMSAVRCNGHVSAILYQSLVMNEASRPPISFLAPEAIAEAFKKDKRPIVTLCSICARIKMNKISPHSWVNSDFYYRLGGKADVRLSHGICPACFEGGEGIRAAG